VYLNAKRNLQNTYVLVISTFNTYISVDKWSICDEHRDSDCHNQTQFKYFDSNNTDCNRSNFECREIGESIRITWL